MYGSVILVPSYASVSACLLAKLEVERNVPLCPSVLVFLGHAE